MTEATTAIVPPVDQPTAEATPAKAINWRFRARPADIRLPREETARQSAVAEAAFRALPGPGRAAAFLNTEDAGLGGRPIDLAIASDAGLEAVLTALSARADKAA